MRSTMQTYQLIIVLIFSFLPLFTTQDSFTPIQSIRDNETLVSADGNFEAGFFSFGSSISGYFGIWYKNITPRTIVWVANRDNPLRNSSGDFILTHSGNLAIIDDAGDIVWSSNSSRIADNPIMQLLDMGNLVVSDGNSTDSILWESFDYPGDTLLPGMKFQSNLVTGPYRYLTSWRNTEDPTRGEFSYHIDTHGYPQLVATKGETIFYRAGSWNGYHFTGVPWQGIDKLLNFSYVFADKEVSYECEALNSSIVTRLLLNPSGLAQRLMWSDRTQSWEILAAGVMDQCEYYARCGANSNCNNNNSPFCECLQGFTPKFEANWNSYDWSGGCVRRMNLNCHSGDGFLRYTGMKLPDTSSSWFDKIMSLEECETECLKNCSCTAYANLDIRGSGSGCLLWFGDIIDMRKHSSGGQDIYIRLAASELAHNRNSNKKKIAGIVVGLTMLIIGLTILALARWIRRKKLKKHGMKPVNRKDKRKKEEIDLPTFDLSTISIATNNFSISNKLGEGGFGPVYRGLLGNGQEIAVKRLSKSSGQGSEEFKNELVLISDLQHRNLVKLLGCCIDGDERFLIYEFLSNKSLDYLIFDQTRSNLLNWIKRIEIISGIARGLLYLHQDSRLKIIHRDLKTSNILLDDNMDPKISDFGLARAFGGDQIEANTKRVVGTYGYMPPEYAARGSFSVKSDVFSFGVIILEIVSGRKNREFFDPHYNLNLIGYAWRLWSEERALEMIDESLDHSQAPTEVLRCIQVGLLCVQERAVDRPDMLSVVLMLNGEKPLPRPRQPAFYPHQIDPSVAKLSSTNEISFTLLDPR